MSAHAGDLLAWANRPRWAGQPAGHYESYFVRANHPSRPLALWVRYTVFSPRGRPDAARGELWAIWFDGETSTHRAFKQVEPMADCRFNAQQALDVRMGSAALAPLAMSGAVRDARGSLRWSLSARSDGDPPLLMLGASRYDARFPAAKSLVPQPGLHWRGRVELDGRTIELDDWRGSQNHNWGRRHTDRYAWGQVAGFDAHPASFLEVASARLRVAGLWTPLLTPLVLRHRGREYAFNSPRLALRARARVDGFDWHFESSTRGVRIEGRIDAPREAFVGLHYDNPPGGWKRCLNSKIARCELRLRDSGAGIDDTLRSAHGAAFEMLGDDDLGVPIVA
ncbi:MAG TPA: hypothetical protein VJ743_18290 [Albitalea sp.]|nr:hypothetical protein [Albitalea sp.]